MTLKQITYVLCHVNKIHGTPSGVRGAFAQSDRCPWGLMFGGAFVRRGSYFRHDRPSQHFLIFCDRLVKLRALLLQRRSTVWRKRWRCSVPLTRWYSSTRLDTGACSSTGALARITATSAVRRTSRESCPLDVPDVVTAASPTSRRSSPPSATVRSTSSLTSKPPITASKVR